MRPLTVGLVGYGGIGRVHAMAYQAIPFLYGLPADSVKIAGVATTRAETAARAAEEIGCAFWTDDVNALLARPDIDVIDVTVPNVAHEAVVTAAAQAGKHIYCEKPLAMNVDEAKRMVAAVEAAGVQSQMTFNFRFFPAIQHARELIDDGFLGRVFSFRGRYYRASYINPQKPISWRQQRAVAGGGTLYDLGSHIIDLLYFLLGDFGQVQAVVDTLITERPAAAGSAQTVAVDVDDIVLMHARLADGTLGLVESSRMGTGATNELVVEIFGERGAIRFNALDPSWLEVYDVRDSDQPTGGMRGFRRVETVGRFAGAKAPDWSMAPSFLRTHAECQYQFLRAVADGTPATPSLADGLHVQAVMAAAEASAHTGGWVQVADLLA